MAGPPPVPSRARQSFPVSVCPTVCYFFPVYPPSGLPPYPQLRSQGSHFVHPLVTDPGSFAMPGHLTISATGTGQRDAGGPWTTIKRSEG